MPGDEQKSIKVTGYRCVKRVSIKTKLIKILLSSLRGIDSCH